MRSRRHHRSLAIVCILCTLLPLTLYTLSQRYRRYEWEQRDKLAIHGRKSPVHPDVVFLAIDNATTTLDAVWPEERQQSAVFRLMENGFPFPRSVYPHIIERLLDAGAKVVALDIMFPHPRDEDEAFAAALEKHAERVVIGANLESRDQAHQSDSTRMRHSLVPPAQSLIPPAPGMDRRVGFVNFWGDEDDEVVRSVLYRTTLLEMEGKPPAPDDHVFHSLVARILEKSGYGDRVPAAHRPVMFRFIEDIRPLSLYQIFVPSIWERPPYNNGAFFRDKIVLIGPDGNWVKDELRTPFGLTNGPRIHLSALNAALNNDFIYATTGGVNLLLIAAGGALAWALGFFISHRLGRFLLLIAIAAGLYFGAQFAFDRLGFFPIVLGPLVALVGSGVTFSVVEQVLDFLEKARLRRTFERYVSRDVVKELVDNPQSFLNTLGGVRKNITVLFSDVRGFTTLTESADPARLVAQLNEYFTEMVRLVFEQHGTLDKFIGDAVMAHWGSIVSEGEQTDARRTVKTALEMRRALVRLNESWRSRGMLELKFGIGINHGEAVVGNLGSEEKREVSAIGDAVNLASRLEGATKEYHTDLLLGEKVAPLVHEAFLLRTVDLLQVKGKTQPVEVFGVISERPTGAEPDWLQHFEKGVRLYRQREFEAALACFTESSRLQSGDWLTEEYVRRAQQYVENPPGSEWDGVYIMTKK